LRKSLSVIIHDLKNLLVDLDDHNRICIKEDVHPKYQIGHEIGILRSSIDDLRNLVGEEYI